MVVSMKSVESLKLDIHAAHGDVKNKKGARHRTLSRMLSDLPNVPERVVLSYSLSKNEQESFGITIVGGKNTLINDIYIKTVSNDGICGKNESLKVGDQILLINGRSLCGITHDEAVNWFRQCKTHIDIVVSRMMESKPQQEKEKARVISPFHGRILSSSSDGWCEEPIVLEHKSIHNARFGKKNNVR